MVKYFENKMSLMFNSQTSFCSQLKRQYFSNNNFLNESKLFTKTHTHIYKNFRRLMKNSYFLLIKGSFSNVLCNVLICFRIRTVVKIKKTILLKILLHFESNFDARQLTPLDGEIFVTAIRASYFKLVQLFELFYNRNSKYRFKILSSYSGKY